MNKKYTISEQFVIKFYHTFKRFKKMQLLMIADKELSKEIVNDLNNQK